VLATVFSFVVNAQEAENLYHNKYAKLSFVVQPSILKGNFSSFPSYTSMTYSNTFSPQIGVYYNFAQKDNLNFKTGVLLRYVYRKFDLHILQEDIPVDNIKSEDLNTFVDDSFVQVTIPFEIEYIKPITTKVNFVAGFATNLNLNAVYSGVKKLGINLADKDKSIPVYYSEQIDNPITIGVDLSLGLNFKTKIGLIQTEITYIQALTYPVTGTAVIYNLNNTASTWGSYNQKANFIGLGLIIAPKKGWQNFRKNKKDKKIVKN